MNASTITGSTFTLAPQGGSAVAATVSYNADVRDTYTDCSAGQWHDLHGNNYYRRDVFRRERAGVELHMDIHNCRCRPSARAGRDRGYAGESKHDCGHLNDRDGDFQSGDEFVDDHRFDLHADGAGKHLSARHRGLQRRNFGCDVYSGGESGLQHCIHSDAQHEHYELFGSCAVRALHLELYDAAAPVPTVSTTVPTSGATGVNVG